MHELSIAQNLVEAAADALSHVSVRRVLEVRIAVGALSGVAPDALLGAYDIAVEGTSLEGSRLVIRLVPVVARCATCNRDIELADLPPFLCPRCGRPAADVRHGRELDIEAIEVETLDAGADTDGP